MSDIRRTKPKLSLNYFVGIDIPTHIKEEINYFIREKMKKFDHLLDWINMFEYHITLGYLGKITEEQRLRLISVSDRIQFPPFSIGIQGIGFHPIGKNPKVLWVGVKRGREKINAFTENVRSRITNEAGLIPKDSYYPHITISKIKNLNKDKYDLFDFVSKNWDYPFGDFKVDSFHLYRITKSGYTRNHEVKLKNLPYLHFE